MDNKSLSHTRWKCQYHIVFIPKYRKKVLYGKVREDVREIINTLCRYKDVEIIAGAVIAEVMKAPVFGDYGRLIFPTDIGYYSGDTLGGLRLT